MDNYAQNNYNLPHDVVKLPSKGIFYTPKKESLKVGFLTASDENLLMSQNTVREDLIYNLLRSKIYEPGFDIMSMIDVDAQAVLMFLRNTAFGTEYTYTLTDPATNKKFDVTLNVDEVNYIEPTHYPDENGLFSYTLPKTKKIVKVKLLTLKDSKDLEKLEKQYPVGMVAPVVTKRLEKIIVEIDGVSDGSKIVDFISKMPISDSKNLRKFVRECEPKLDLKKDVIAPSGERVTIDVSLGVEFFRPFFDL